MTELFLSAFVTLLVIIDPPGCAPIFAGLTRGADAAHRRAMAVRSGLIALAIEPGPLIMGMAIGKTEMSSASGVPSID